MTIPLETENTDNNYTNDPDLDYGTLSDPTYDGARQVSTPPPPAAAFGKTNDSSIEPAASNNDNNDSNDTNSRAACYKKVLVGLLVLGLIVYVAVDAATNRHVPNAILAFLEWIEDHVWLGVLGFVLVYIVATVAFIPGSVLTLGAGFVFSSALNSLGRGVALGTGAVFVGASVGAILAFLVGRYLFREAVTTRLSTKHPVFEALDAALETNGLKIMVLLRLSPIIPFNALNFLAGVTAVRLGDYALACFAMLPGTVVYVFLGASAGSLAEIGGKGDENENGDENGDDGSGGSSNKEITSVVLAIGISFGFLAIGMTSYYAKKELDRILEADKDNEEEEQDGTEAVEANENETRDTAGAVTYESV